MPKVTDFGLVKLVTDPSGVTHTGMALGTPEYMSPEQIRDAHAVDQRTDMWALGCILYELVCGVRPFCGEDRKAIFHKIVDGAFDPPADHVSDLPAHVQETLLALLSVDPEDRPVSPEDVVKRLFPDGTPTSQLRAPDSLAPSLMTVSMPLTFGDEEEPNQDDAADMRGRTANPALARRGNQVNKGLSTRATAEFPAFRMGETSVIGWSALVPIAIATVVGLLLTIAVVGPFVGRFSEPPPVVGAVDDPDDD